MKKIIALVVGILFAGMAAAHEAWVASLFVGLSQAQQSQLHGLLGALKSHLQPR